MSGLFITSTGTGIGKTFVAEHLLKWDSLQQNRRFNGSKPIITGWPKTEKEIYQTDTSILLHAQQKEITESQIEAISPWRFHPPLTPAMAAIQEGKLINFAELIEYCQKEIDKAKSQKQIHLIEGVGGIMSPIWGRSTGVNWIKEVGCACILVTGSYLGTLSHTLTALSVLENFDIEVLAVIVNESPQSSVSLIETSEYLASLLSPIKVISLPYFPQVPDFIQNLYLHLLGKFAVRSF